MLGAALRFIPYVGPVLGAGAPIVVSLAALEGWTGPLEVMALYTVLELITNLILETALYAGAAGVSQVALLMSVAFWTWLWGPMGLLMATPLTVCFVVLGKHVPGLEFVGTLMSDTPALAKEHGYYQRLLAHDQGEAADLIDQYIKSDSPQSVFDVLVLPALNYAERDRLQLRLSPEEEMAVIEATRELVSDAAHSLRQAAAKVAPATDVPLAPAGVARQVLGYASNGIADELALAMLGHLLDDQHIVVEITKTRMLAAELLALVQERGVSVVCIADLPPSPASKTRYLVKRLRAAFPELQILVGRWAPPALADDSSQALRDAGASHVASTLAQSRDYLAALPA
jgi:hypothetical protein